MAAVALAAGGHSAQAACVHRTKIVDGATIAKPARMPPVAPLAGPPVTRYGNSIVGLWHVAHYLDDGSLYFESFEHYHSDGTEFEFANINPITGDVCMGVWKPLNQRKVSLFHIGWVFDASGNPAGTFTLAGPRRVSRSGNHLEGTFDAKIYDSDGNLVEEDTGTTAGDRIPVE